MSAALGATAGGAFSSPRKLVGAFHNRGQDWQPVRVPIFTNVYDFPTTAGGKAISYGVYDIANNKAWVSVGIDHDTPAFAVNSIRSCWKKMGRLEYP